MGEPVWTNSMCNKLGPKHAVTDTIDYIFHKEKPKVRRATYVR